MYVLFSLISFGCLIFMIIGFFNPKKSLFWIKDESKINKKVSFISYFISFLFFGFISDLCENKSESTTIVKKENNLQNTLPNKDKSNWEYSTQIDEMSEKTMYFASSTSINSHEFDFPYNGGAFLFLTIRNMNGKNEVIVEISKGQIHGSYNDEVIRFKFDNGNPEPYYFSSASDGSSNIAFINQSNKLIDKIRKSKKVKVDIPVFQEGRPVFDFNIEGLIWKH